MADQKGRQFKVLKFVGKGSYGSVFLVQRMADGQTYALKEMDVRSMSQAEREDSANEIRLLASVSHANVIAYNEAFLDGNRLCIIMEYAPDGDLAKIIKKHQMMKRPIPEDQIWRYFIQVVLGIQALHGMKILHRDIKPGNIMVFENGMAKVGDLGIAKLLTKTAAAKTQIGTPHYMPPEIWKNRPYSFTSDTWALGCLLYELSTLSVPFEARSMSELRYKVLRGTFPPLPSTFSRDLAALVRDCLEPNPDKRPSLDALMAHPSITSRLHLLPHECRHPPSSGGYSLIETIKVPRGNIQAIKNKLPPANYAKDMPSGSGGSGVQMATIGEEGNSDDDVQPVSAAQQRAAAARAQPVAPPKPSYAPPAPQPQQLPRLHGGYGGPTPGAINTPSYAQAQAAAQAAALRMPKLPGSHAPSAANTPSYADGNTPAWFHPSPSKQSESHASYGAFYSNPAYTPTAQGSRAASQAQAQQPVAPWQQQIAAKWQQQQAAAAAAIQQYQQQYASPFASPYGHQQRDARLGGYAAAGKPTPPVQQPQAAAQPSKPPPWNYGHAQARAAAARARMPSSNGNSAGSKAAAGGGIGGGPDVQRYQPAQYAAKAGRAW